VTLEAYSGIGGRALVRLFLHHGDAKTCDAVQQQFVTTNDANKIPISVFQTQFIILVRAVPGPSTIEGVQLENELGGDLFKHNGRLNLTLMNQDATGAFGGQDSDADTANFDWLDTMVWWTDGSAMCYRMLKRTGPGQSAIVSSAFGANHIWFAAFETPMGRN
jgi:hypothetical protein